VTNESENKDRRGSFENVGRRMDDEIDKLISYINDEVVPNVRQHSSKGLRIAADRLKQFADYMDERQTPAQPRNHESEEDIGS
jgi:hypothetical protein